MRLFTYFLRPTIIGNSHSKAKGNVNFFRKMLKNDGEIKGKRYLIVAFVGGLRFYGLD